MNAILDLDRRLFLLLNGAPSPAWLDSFFVALTRDELILSRLLILSLFAFLLWRSPAWRRRALWLIPLIAIADSLNSQILKDIFARPRPCQEALEGIRQLVDCGPAFSFPSSHAANMGAVGVFLALGARGLRSRILILALPLLVAYSRVHVGVHYPLDVLAGFTEGAVLALIFESLLRRLPKQIRLLPARANSFEEPAHE
jgi:undecaprenyl-diphosphatase